MTVEELIRKLQQMPPDCEVLCDNGDRYTVFAPTVVESRHVDPSWILGADTTPDAVFVVLC